MAPQFNDYHRNRDAKIKSCVTMNGILFGLFIEIGRFSIGPNSVHEKPNNIQYYLRKKKKHKIPIDQFAREQCYFAVRSDRAKQ